MWAPDPVFVLYSKLPQFAKYDVENGFLLDVKGGNSTEFTVEAR